jgi:hypothetical protein
MIAVAGWRTYLQDDATALPMQLWLVQMILNFALVAGFFHAASQLLKNWTVTGF